jgi:hypothetical protein
MKRFAAVHALSLCPALLLADTPDQILERYAELAKQEDPAFAGFSAGHGHERYLQKRVLPVVGAINCASCHMADPREEILAHKSKVLCRQCHVIHDSEHPHPKDAKLREIPPLAPSAQEKGDIIAWLISVK